MAKSNKDSAEVVTFLGLFARLKDWTDDDPVSLSALAKNDASIRKLCGDLSWAAHLLKVNERRRRQLFAAPADSQFIQTWRDYEERYQSTLAGVWLSELFIDWESLAPTDMPRADTEWENADCEAREQDGGIRDAIHFAQFNVDQEDRWTEQPEFIERIQDGIAAWEALKEETGFDLRGIFRRRALVPFVLVPRKIAAREGSSEKLSLLKSLQQAHEAFVFGATFGAIALMRSIMEAVLRDHYRAEGKDLCDRIYSTRGRLPPGANEAALHRLRKLANAILHFDREKEVGLPSLDDVNLEKEIVSLLFVLRALIEGAK